MCILSVNRRPPEEQQQQAVDMLAAGAKPRFVARMLQQQNIPVSIRDVYNMRHSPKLPSTKRPAHTARLTTSSVSAKGHCSVSARNDSGFCRQLTSSSERPPSAESESPVSANTTTSRIGIQGA